MGEDLSMKFVTVKPILLLASIAFMGCAGIRTAFAAGCLTGAAVGGVAGHLPGHGVVGAAAGCAIGHHEAFKKAKAAADQQAGQHAPSSGANPPPN